MSDPGETLEVTFQIRRLVHRHGKCGECGHDTSGYVEVSGHTVQRAERFLLLDLSQLKGGEFRAGIADHLGKNIAACIRHYLEDHPVVKEAEDDSSDKTS